MRKVLGLISEPLNHEAPVSLNVRGRGLGLTLQNVMVVECTGMESVGRGLEQSFYLTSEDCS